MRESDYYIRVSNKQTLLIMLETTKQLLGGDGYGIFDNEISFIQKVLSDNLRECISACEIGEPEPVVDEPCDEVVDLEKRISGLETQISGIQIGLNNVKKLMDDGDH